MIQDAKVMATIMFCRCISSFRTVWGQNTATKVCGAEHGHTGMWGHNMVTQMCGDRTWSHRKFLDLPLLGSL